MENHILCVKGTQSEIKDCTRGWLAAIECPRLGCDSTRTRRRTWTDVIVKTVVMNARMAKIVSTWQCDGFLYEVIAQGTGQRVSNAL